MNKVWVLRGKIHRHDWRCGKCIIGVYSSKEKAEEFIQKDVDEYYATRVWEDFFNGNWTEEEVKESLKRDYDLTEFEVH